MMFSDLYKIMVNKAIFVGFRGAIAPESAPGQVLSDSVFFLSKLRRPVQVFIEITNLFV